MVDIGDKKQKIINFLQNNGPSLPVRISKVIEMEPVFASAILSELYSDRKVKMSNMKVGSSSLFYLEGQEEKLQDFIENLKSIEKEAFARIKSRKVLVDDDEEPAIRVAIRGMKDFAIPVERDGKLYWKFAFINDEEFENYFRPREKVPEEKVELKDEKKEEKTEESEEKEKIAEETSDEITEESIKKKENKKRIKKDESEKQEKKIEGIFDDSDKEFFEEIKKYLLKKMIDVDEEIQVDKKEVIARISFETKIGRLNFLLIAKNKKSISKDELNIVMQRVNYHKMPCLLITKGSSRSVQNLIKDNNMIKLEPMEP